MSEFNILMIDDEAEWMLGLRRTLDKYGISPKEHIHTATNGREAFKTLENCDIDLILLDLYLDNESGENLLAEILARKPEQAVVIMTGSNSVESAVNCMKKGARDYFVKSTPVSELISNIRRIQKIIELQSENKTIKNRIAAKEGNYAAFAQYITCSQQIYSIFDYISALQKSPHHILITGESGVGKGVLAKIIAELHRPGEPFVAVNVSGYDDQMFADTLFGHVKGAFTGADSAREGMLRQAGNGVIFLDEIGDLSLQSQIKLLYLIQEGTYQQLGSDKQLQTKAKFVFATNQDLSEKLREKSFRNDLFFRLNTHRLHIPPLRERPEDIALLVSHFAEEAMKDFDKEIVFSDKFMAKIKQMPLPGNIRQLKYLLHDLTARHDGLIDAEQLMIDAEQPEALSVHPDSKRTEACSTSENIPTIDEMTNDLIKRAMALAGGNQMKAAKMLGISQPTLSRKWKDLK